MGDIKTFAVLNARRLEGPFAKLVGKLCFMAAGPGKTFVITMACAGTDIIA
jgi:hypothetical protein